MSRTTGRRRLACHHEAGHALVRWFFGHLTDRAVVLTVAEVRAGIWPIDRRDRPSIGSEGVVEGYDIHGYPYGPLDALGSHTAQLRATGRDIELIYCSAGIAAEACYRKWSTSACALAGGRGDMEQARVVLDGWNLEGEERRELELLSDRRASALVRSHSGSTAIKNMANALMERGEIDGDEISEICRAAYGGRQPAFGVWNDHWPPSLTDLRAGRIPD